MDQLGDVSLRSVLVSRTVGRVFGILASFVVILRVITRLELDPFANLLVRVLLLPGYVVMLGYTVLLVNLYPEVGRVGIVLGAVIYIYLVSVILAGVYRMVR